MRNKSSAIHLFFFIFFTSGERFFNDRQGYNHVGTFADLAVNTDGTIVFLYDLFYKVETKSGSTLALTPGAVLIDTVEGIEDAVLFHVGDTNTVIAD